LSTAGLNATGGLSNAGAQLAHLGLTHAPPQHIHARTCSVLVCSSPSRSARAAARFMLSMRCCSSSLVRSASDSRAASISARARPVRVFCVLLKVCARTACARQGAGVVRACLAAWSGGVAQCARAPGVPAGDDATASAAAAALLPAAAAAAVALAPAPQQQQPSSSRSVVSSAVREALSRARRALDTRSSRSCARWRQRGCGPRCSQRQR
jgi:hypothetical protein